MFFLICRFLLEIAFLWVCWWRDKEKMRRMNICGKEKPH